MLVELADQKTGIEILLAYWAVERRMNAASTTDNLRCVTALQGTVGSVSLVDLGADESFVRCSVLARWLRTDNNSVQLRLAVTVDVCLVLGSIFARCVFLQFWVVRGGRLEQHIEFFTDEEPV